jgi:hypothetical protein
VVKFFGLHKVKGIKKFLDCFFDLDKMNRKAEVSKESKKEFQAKGFP